MALADLKGATPKVIAALSRAGISNEKQLLEAGKTPADRKKLAQATDVSEEALLELLNRADLSRVKGIGQVYSNLLEEAGVDTVKELARRNPENLHAKIVAVAEEKKLAQRLPDVEEVAEWISQAKELPPAIEY